MKRITLIIASLVVFIITATAQAQTVPITDVTVSPITTPHPAVTAHVDGHHYVLRAVLWLDWGQR